MEHKSVVLNLAQKSRQEEERQAATCLDHGKGDCAGPVEFRMALSSTGRSFPRCEYHWDLRLDEQERINRTYPDSPCAPAWFDPADAGESWEEV